MDREQLAELVFEVLRSNRFQDELWPTRDDLVAALWPVLAQVWTDGRTAALEVGLFSVNPYQEWPPAHLCTCNHPQAVHDAEGQCPDWVACGCTGYVLAETGPAG